MADERKLVGTAQDALLTICVVNRILTFLIHENIVPPISWTTEFSRACVSTHLAKFSYVLDSYNEKFFL